ncbi:MAG TPA: hypothetical protein VGD21_10990 [Lysobacter sp.]
MTLRLLLVLSLLAAPLAHADDECRLTLGRGWPPATENYGTAVEKLFANGAAPALALTRLPTTGTESGLLLIPGSGDGDWTLRSVQADQRVHYWAGAELQLRVDQEPEVNEAPIPAAVALRLVADWRKALGAAVPEDQPAQFSEDETWLFVVADPRRPGQTLRVSGTQPGCEIGERLREQIDLLIEASDEGETKRERRWRQLERSLDELRRALPAIASTGQE